MWSLSVNGLWKEIKALYKNAASFYSVSCFSAGGKKLLVVVNLVFFPASPSR